MKLTFATHIERGLWRHLLGCQLFIYCLALTAFGSPTVATAQDSIEPEFVTVSTPYYRPDLVNFEPPLGTYSYGVSWQGIPAASAEVTIDQAGANYLVSASAKTASAIDLFYTLRYRADGEFSAIDMQPHKVTIRNQEGSKVRSVDMSFLGDGEVFTVRSQNNQKPAKIVRFNPNNNMLDPFSATVLARSLDWSVGKSFDFDIFNGKSRYLITMTAIDEAQVEVNGKKHDCWVVSPTVKNLTNTKANNKLREAKMYVTKDRSRDVLKIVSEVFIGAVTIELESFKPSNSQTAYARLNLAKEVPSKVR